MTAAEREERLKVFEANYGRDFGWFVERDGRKLAALTDPRFEDMFWVSYAVEPLGETPGERDAVFTKDFWEPPGLTFRNRVTSEVIPSAFHAGSGPTRDRPRVIMRGLYTSMEPTAFERVLLWFRRRRRR
jgi:hypothetical protein